MSLKLLVTIVTVLTCIVCTNQERYTSRADTHPACYKNLRNTPLTETPCKHPLYTSCRYGGYTDQYYILCCSPDHYCCKDNRACCRKTTNAYEVVGIVFAALAWVVILAILSMCFGVHIKKHLSKKKRVYPVTEMKKRAPDT